MKYLKIIFFLISPISLLAQQPYLKQFTNEDGLPSMIIYQISQDDDGFLWLGTENGFCRFDGNEFISYENDEAKDNEFIGVYTSPTNVTWCWNLSGQLFYVNNSKLELYEPMTKLDDFGISKVVGDKDGNIWISNSKWFKFQYLECDKDGNCNLKTNIRGDQNIFKFLKNHHKNNPNEYLSLRKLNYFFFPKNSKLTTYFKKYLGITAHFFFDIDGTLHLYTNKNLIVTIDLKDNEFVIKELPAIDKIRNSINTTFSRVDIDKAGNWWFITNNGLFAFSKDFEPLNSGKPIVSNLIINNFLGDNEGGYWIGTNGKGLYYMPNYRVQNFNKENSSLKNNTVKEVILNKSKKVIAVTHKGDVYEINSQEANLMTSLNTSIDLIIPSNFQKGKKFILANKKELNIFDDNFKKQNKKTLSLLSSVKDIYENDSSYFIGNQNHFLSFKKKNFVDLSKKEINYIFEERTYAIEHTFDGNLLIGTIKGLYIYDGETLAPYQVENEDLNVWINDIEQSKDSTIWIATEKKGIFKIKKDKSIEHFQTTNGLASNSCEKLYIDSLENIWVITNNGLSYYDKKLNYFSTINQTNGLSSNLVKSILVNDDKVWIGTTKGVSFFDKNEIIASANYKLPIKITRVIFDEVEQSIDSFYHIDLSPNSVQFEFISSTFKHNGKIKYRYKMSGIDKSWQETTSNTVLYNHLHSGHYTFEVGALDKFGKINEIETIKLFIPTPYWQKWWFYLLVGMLSVGGLAAIIYGAFKMYKTRKDKELAISRKIGELRMNALQSQMNPHFTFNALNAIQNFFTTNEREMAMIYLSKFARLIRLSFEYSKESVISLDREIDFLKLYLKLEKLRFQEKIAFNFQSDDLINPDDIMIPPLLIQPIVENVFKHGLLHKETGGKLDLIFRQVDDKTIHCIIEDNGIGRENAAKYTKWKPKEYKSSGVKTIQERIDLINQENEYTSIQFKITDLTDHANNPTGTKVEFWFKSLH